MELTFIGIIQLVIGGAIVIAGSLRSAVLLLMISGAFGASASILLPALGGSSIPPFYFALLFVYLRILAPRGGFLGELPDAFRANRWLALFTVYGMAIAYIGPRIFAGRIDVFPMDGSELQGMFETVPLGPSSQNLTAMFYLLGALLVAMAAWIVVRKREGVDLLVSAAIAVGWIHVVLGVGSVIARGTPLDAIFEVFRNADYAQPNADVGGFVRINGVFAEASSYAQFGFAFFALNAELWYRSVRPRATGSAAAALLAVLFFSTSSTAYVGLAAYLAFFALRALVFPTIASGSKVRTVMLLMTGLAVVTAILLAVVPHLSRAVYEMILHMTVEKSDSSSAQQRLFWAMQGWHAFFSSYGLGIGPGSFRSSSAVTAIMGATGVIGCLGFLFYVVSVLQPWRRSTWASSAETSMGLGGAFAASAMLILVPAAINAESVQPVALFYVLAGAALGLRPYRTARALSDEDGTAVAQWRRGGEQASAGIRA